MKNNKCQSLLIKNALWCKNYHKSAHFSTSHDDISIHHKPHFPQITSVFKPSHNMVHSAEERFAMERMATRGFGSKKIAAALGVPEATTERCFSCYLSHIARIVMCGCKKERVRAAALINTWISVEPCCTVAGVRKRLQASGIERGRSSVQSLMTAGHRPAKHVIRG